MENSISNTSRVLDLKVSLSLSAISNNSRLMIQTNCNRTPVWTLCAVGSRGSPTKSVPFSCITVTGSYQTLSSYRNLTHSTN